ncbi:MAG: tRNA uridine-5-carboxymethylaminomethyl(34) synthesis GTPase MnmE [Gammaproteobacteria bacterium]|nr:tRNA uridine-5-carboxymethylaminomethyl(34) synthesis GTPase MnmE [Gammaproteobacteria bacterium]
MNPLFQDTIAAQATPPGRGGIGIIRISGQAASEVAQLILGRLPSPRYATFCDFLDHDGSVIDQGLALYFKSPYSFTGEDVLELHAHGGSVVIDILLQRILKLGVRMARPGEFSERAFLNDKIDLTQAEAIADLIEASSAEAARSAINSLQGKFSEQIRRLVNEFVTLRVYVEAAIDFPEEEIDFLSDGKILTQLKGLMAQLETILIQAKQGRALNEGMKVVIAGYPNAGKSSLLNNLSGHDSAIVSDIPGTTRDVIRETILIDGLPLHVIDTAGLREESETADIIELEGMKRAWHEIPQADRILLVVDAVSTAPSQCATHELLQQFKGLEQRLTLIRNKIDLTGEAPLMAIPDNSGFTVINVSAKTDAGIDLLKKHLKECMGYGGGNNLFIARRRHLEALLKAQSHCLKALEQLVEYKAGELVAQELREAQNALSEITGEFRNDDLLGEIFSSFCIGK